MVAGLCKFLGVIFILGAVAAGIFMAVVGASFGAKHAADRGAGAAGGAAESTALGFLGGVYGLVAAFGLVLIGAVFFALAKYLGAPPAERVYAVRRSRLRGRYRSG